MSQVRKQSSLLAALFLIACSGGGDPPSGSNGGSPGGGSGGSRGGGSGGASASNGGSSGGGGSSGSGGSTAAVDPNAVVGLFTVRLVAASQDAPTPYTAVAGKVEDGPTPSRLVWTSVEKVNGCELRTPMAPFCASGCPGAVCVGMNQCAPEPNAKNVGKVEAKLGTTTVPLEAIGGVYGPPGSVTLPSPPCPEGSEISFKSAGGDYPSFTVLSKGIIPLELMGPTTIPFSGDQPLKLMWAPGKPDNARIEVRVDISHHGGLKGEIVCDVPDSGSLDIPASMTKKLIDLGVAGFPTVYVTRVAPGEARLSHGRVLLRVESSVERALKIPGVESCHDDKDCPMGKTCNQKDLRCSQ